MDNSKQTKMKKTLLLITIVLSTLSGYAQTEKGKKMIGGQFNFSGYNSNNQFDSLNRKSNTFSTQIKPSFGYFVKDNFAIGAIVNVSLSSRTDKTGAAITDKIKSADYGVGGFVRSYKKISDNFFFFGNASLVYTYGVTNGDYVTYSQKAVSNNINFTVSPGLVYFPTSRLGIECSFGNVHFRQDFSKNKSTAQPNHISSSDYGISLSPSSFYLGMNYYF
jgi:hypothetical protein